ncbi:hypothetical protein WKK05_40565 (plasmid) [Nostoc sp. UHCC 0302]|uniref:hypothetical protein n=1 Tax=Nostoc sp. UHCC 0302 TaxID=3134896 RepID=UPI00311C9FE3
MTATEALRTEENKAIVALSATIEATDSVPQDKKSFGAMNGVTVEYTLESGSELVEPENPPDPEEIVTTRAVTQHPLLKAGVIGSGIFLVVAVAGGMINASMNALTNSTAVSPQPIKQADSAEDTEETVSENPGKIKTALAITSQKPELESIRNISKPIRKGESANASADPNSTASTNSKAVASTTSPVPTSQRQYTPVPQGQPISVRRNPTLQPPISREAVSTKSSFAPTPRPQPQSIALGMSVGNKLSVDPQQQWLAVSNVGSFSASSDATTEEPINTEGLAGGTGTSPVNTSTNVAETSSNQENVDYNARRVIVGTRTEGKLETPIVISAGNTNQVQKYLIRLTKPLKASDGQEILPINSYLVVVPNSTTTSEYIQMSAVSALINVNGQTLEKAIPENSVIILNKNGEILKAQSRKGSNLGSDLMAAVIGGISKAAEVQNNPSSQTTVSSNGFSSSTVSNDNRSLVAGFTQGSFDQVLQRMQSSNTQQIQSLQSDTKVYVVPANTTVQIFVNQSISL